jgi:hypothetical protein
MDGGILLDIFYRIDGREYSFAVGSDVKGLRAPYWN